MNSTSRLVRSGAALVAIAALIAGCGGSTDQAAPSPSPTPSPTPSRTATPTPTPTPTSVLTGLPATDGPALVLKIDNSSKSIPHVGLSAADVVYVQQVEGGQSRLAAVYSTTLPKQVGPIRSARETDAELLPQYGEVAFGFSGSVASVHRLVKKAGLIDVSADVSGVGYSRVSGRRAPYNMMAAPSTLLGRVSNPPKPADVGFRFGAAPSGGTRATTVTAKYPTSTVSFTYGSNGLWRYSLNGRKDGTTGDIPAASTVIVQSVKVTMLNRGDVTGTRVPFSATVGSGKALILRDGRAYNATWQRTAVDKPTRWLIGGKDVPLKAGQVWVVLLDAKRAATISN